MNPAKAKEILSIRTKELQGYYTPDFIDALSLAITALDLLDKVITLDSTGGKNLHLLRAYCEACFKEQWHIITTSGRLECLGCRAK